MRGAVAVLLSGWLLVAQAADCKRSESICVDASPSKTISGVTVTLAEVGGCWEFEDTYTCLKPDAVNYCQPLIELQPRCWQTSSRCAQMDTVLGSGCMRYAQTWQCGDPSMPTPSGTIRLDEAYTLVSSQYDPGPCQSLSGNANCQIAESTCVSSTPPPLPTGIPVGDVAPDGCFERQDTYACYTGRTDTSECDALSSNPLCSLLSSTCTSGDSLAGQCAIEQQSFRCVSVPERNEVTTDCSGQTFCLNGQCFDRGYPNDPDFARTMALLETAREAGVYGSETEIFGGTDASCRIRLFGLANCCKKSSGGESFSNFNLLGTALKVGGEGLDVGSSYVYDALYDAPMLQEGLGAALGGLGADGLFNPSFSFYGFSFQFLPSQGFIFTGFDPTSLAIQLAIMIVQELLTCEQTEQILAIRRGLNLCHEVGTYCSKELKLLGAKICIENTKSHCCFNSRLARIINEQGRQQAGKGWGNPRSPDCSGFTPEQFASLDFSKIDLSEFTAEIMANIRLPDQINLGQGVKRTVEQKLQNFYQR